MSEPQIIIINYSINKWSVKFSLTTQLLYGLVPCYGIDTKPGLPNTGLTYVVVVG